MSKYVLSEDAQHSLHDIYAYSTRQFGKKRAKQYLGDLRNSMRKLAENPLLGRERVEIKRGYYSYFVGSLTIYYRVRKDHIEIINVLHQSMEPSIHL